MSETFTPAPTFTDEEISQRMADLDNNNYLIMSDYPDSDDFSDDEVTEYLSNTDPDRLDDLFDKVRAEMLSEKLEELRNEAVADLTEDWYEAQPQSYRLARRVADAQASISYFADLVTEKTQELAGLERELAIAKEAK